MKVLTKKWCVYAHRAGNELFYVGSGTPARAFDTYSRTQSWRNIVSLNGGEYSVDIISWHDTRDDAYEAEKALICRRKPTTNRRHKKSVGSSAAYSTRLVKIEEKHHKAIAEYAKRKGIFFQSALEQMIDLALKMKRVTVKGKTK